MPRSLTSILADFQRECDEAFDEILGRWRASPAEGEPAIVVERSDAFEVRLATGRFKASDLEVMASENKLTVRAAHGQNSWQRTFTFAEPVQTENVSAKWLDRCLTIVLPKKGKRPPDQTQ